MREKKIRFRNVLAIGGPAILVLACVLFWQPLTIWWYFSFHNDVCELPPNLIRPCFREITRRDLPLKTDKAKALFNGGHDPAIFARFVADSQGVDHIVSTFCPNGTVPEKIGYDYMAMLSKSGLPLFVIPSQWEDRLGVCLFDRDTIEAGRVIEYSGPPSSQYYKIFIGSQTNTVYVFAMRR